MLNQFTLSAGAVTALAGLAAVALVLDMPRLGFPLLALAAAGLPLALVWGLRRHSSQLRTALTEAESGDASRLTLPAGDERDAAGQLRLVIAQLAADEIALAAARSRLEARLTDLEQRLPPESDTP